MIGSVILKDGGLRRTQAHEPLGALIGQQPLKVGRLECHGPS
jgi:hypothetical protein